MHNHVKPDFLFNPVPFHNFNEIGTPLKGGQISTYSKQQSVITIRSFAIFSFRHSD
jgi:hypothetical protein